ncbi:hypothetical protein MPLA_1390166 [Mesorhizobium sp. ORS 3359]|nr:hypothetical protein MPLA_1390166 [Mesorhizobium sp. ORS 3359]
MDRKALAGLGRDPYRRWGLSPRPENINDGGMEGEAGAVNWRLANLPPSWGRCPAGQRGRCPASVTMLGFLAPPEAGRGVREADGEGPS